MSRQVRRMEGVYTALVTPWTPDGELDEVALRRLVRRQLAAGVAGVVVAGTTGEAPTLDRGELTRLVAEVAEESAGATSSVVVAGVGGNDTRRCCELARTARRAGADALLVVTPYYVKPTQRGLVAHFRAVADAGELPVVLYSVPGRTGVRLEAETALELAEDPRFVAVKEASGCFDTVQRLLAGRPGGFAVLAGDDALALPFLALGADGVVSVISNQVPEAFVELVAAGLAGDRRRASELQMRLWPLMRANFVESNPIPVKWALARMGLAGEHLRLPLTPLASAHQPLLEQALLAAGALPSLAEVGR